MGAWARASWLILLAAFAVASLELGTRCQARWRAFPPPLERPLPKGLDTLALGSALGDASRLAADLCYVDCLQYIGGRHKDGFYGRTLERYARVQWLDPSFRHAIIEGISVLGWMLHRPDDAQALGNAAMAADHGEKRYGAYLAGLAFLKKLDIDGVLKVLLPEARRPDAPAMTLRLVGNLYLRKHDWNAAVRYWASIAPRLKSPQDQAFALKSIQAARAHKSSIYSMGGDGL